MRLVLLSLVLALSACGIAQAQFDSTTPLSLTLTPTYPRPNSTAIVSVDSAVIDLNASTVTVSVNGEVAEEGSGVTNVSVPIGASGSTTRITVVAIQGAERYTQELLVRPGDVALVVEPLTTSHPFYKGGSLIASEGRLRLVALPELRTANGAAVNPTQLVYTWRLNGSIMQSSSGIGKSVITAAAPVRYRSAEVSVLVTTQDQSVVAESAVTISPADPLVRIYRTDPLLGTLFGAALRTPFVLGAEEEGFKGVGYHFADAPQFSWSVNGSPSETDDDITLRPTGDGSGTALVSLSARLQEPRQSAEASVSVRYGEERFLGIFGL
jgi:hypothetical protein